MPSQQFLFRLCSDFSRNYLQHLLCGDQLFGVEQLTVGTGSDIVDYRRLEIQEDTSWHVLAGTSLKEESIDSIIHDTVS
jgi:hypothetical protein